MIDEILRSKYSDIIFYCHNLGGFDSIFILKILNDHNERNNIKVYKTDEILRDGKIIKLTIKKGNKSVVLLDSYCMLTTSLDQLAKDFGVSTTKSVFPYGFSNHSNIFYKGDTPDYSYYKDITLDYYKTLYKND
jgi:hypothetical protein